MKDEVREDDAADALLAALRGRWRVARRIADRRGGRDARFTGIAVFAPEAGGAGLVFAERGWLTPEGGPPLRAERRTRWAAQAGRIVVRFADGRAFHDFAPDDARATHPCGADTYRVAYAFAADGRAWEAVWEVTGPAKDYVSVTRYRR